MSNEKRLNREAMRVLKRTSRTFYIPIKLLNPTLRKTVGAAYLCMRAIDQIEDHETLSPEIKAHLLRSTKELLERPFDRDAYEKLLAPYGSEFEEVTLRMGDWLDFCPDEIVEKVKESTAIMADGMAKWVEKGFQVHTKEELDEYTYYVAGLVGVMLSDIWEWYDGTKTERDLAIGYGRGLQAVNMLRNQDEDFERGVEFIPDGWNRDDMFQYAEENLEKAKQYIKMIETKNILLFCRIPYALAEKTLAAMKSGKEKMSRQEVEQTVDHIIKE